MHAWRARGCVHDLDVHHLDVHHLDVLDAPLVLLNVRGESLGGESLRGESLRGESLGGESLRGESLRGESLGTLRDQQLAGHAVGARALAPILVTPPSHHRVAHLACPLGGMPQKTIGYERKGNPCRARRPTQVDVCAYVCVA